MRGGGAGLEAEALGAGGVGGVHLEFLTCIRNFQGLISCTPVSYRSRRGSS